MIRNYEVYAVNKIARVDLSRNNLGDEGMKYIANVLRVTTSIVHLSVASNQLTYRGVKALQEEGVNRNNTLISLDLSTIEGVQRNRCNWKGAEAIARSLCQKDCMLQILQLGAVSIGTKGAEILFGQPQMIRSLVSLDISKNEITFNEQLIKNLGIFLHTSPLEILHISHNAISDDVFPHFFPFLTPNLSLRKFFLADCRLTQKSLAQFLYLLQNLYSLEELQICQNSLASASQYVGEKTHLFYSLEGFLTKNLSIKRLSMAECLIADPLAQAIGRGLARNKELQELDLSQNKIKDEGCVAIAQGLVTGNLQLQVLKLASNEIGCKGAEKLAEVVRKMGRMQRGIRKLDLYNNLIRKEGATHLLEAIKSNQLVTSLNLDMNVSLPQSLLDALPQVLTKNKIFGKKLLVPGFKREQRFLALNSRASDLEQTKQEIEVMEKVHEKEFERLENAKDALREHSPSNRKTNPVLEKMREELEELEREEQQLARVEANLDRQANKVQERGELKIQKFHKDQLEMVKSFQDIGKEIKKWKEFVLQRKRENKLELDEYQVKFGAVKQKLQIQELMIKSKEKEINVLKLALRHRKDQEEQARRAEEQKAIQMSDQEEDEESEEEEVAPNQGKKRRRKKNKKKRVAKK